ncbi:unnamed protein product [Oikopleura dioica]|uniref:Prefoldin subunit 6 n=2 Tax=Oikopleura dioica TaxID=34765 RepID=E4XD77_OIKDI|nr:unnamed protein product [Oikopleura dioica]
MSVDIQHILSNMQAGLQDQAAKVKEATKHRDNFAQNIAKLEAQLNETKVVMDELEKVEEGRNIFKLLGPCLVLQDKEIAMQTIKNRHSHMSSELKKTEDNTKKYSEQIIKEQAALNDLAEKAEQIRRAIQQQQQA